eukprot:m.112820 g.112820  ORF g.112820 m.112820 type:complete len:81 (-) comp14105_c0_seq2:291-533(-)
MSGFKFMTLQTIILFGRNGSSMMVFCVILRLVHGWGRAAVREETLWISDRFHKAVIRAEEYLNSEHVGELALVDIIKDIV